MNTISKAVIIRLLSEKTVRQPASIYWLVWTKVSFLTNPIQMAMNILNVTTVSCGNVLGDCQRKPVTPLCVTSGGLHWIRKTFLKRHIWFGDFLTLGKTSCPVKGNLGSWKRSRLVQEMELELGIDQGSADAGGNFR